MAKIRSANQPCETHSQESVEAAACPPERSRLSQALFGDGRWRMPGFFAAAVLATACTLTALAAIADPAGIQGGLAPILVPQYMTYPVTIVVGA